MASLVPDDAAFRSFLNSMPDAGIVRPKGFKAIRCAAISADADLGTVEGWVAERGGARRMGQVPTQRDGFPAYEQCDHLLVPVEVLAEGAS